MGIASGGSLGDFDCFDELMEAMAAMVAMDGEAVWYCAVLMRTPVGSPSSGYSDDEDWRLRFWHAGSDCSGGDDSEMA